MSIHAQSSGLLTALRDHRYMRLTTYRRTGAPVTTPVWFVMNDHAVFLYTLASAGKLKRIRNNPKVTVAPADSRGNPLGAEYDGLAQILPETEGRMIDQLMGRKYGLQLTALKLMYRLQKVKRVFIQIETA
ncbi:MAG TPA: PPOX class F420-dependent oxidoreductase [Anaerolineales bacterium]|nr:PPOX class F420-dependent oxidoreductase [Anaerolineales bacterium]